MRQITGVLEPSGLRINSCSDTESTFRSAWTRVAFGSVVATSREVAALAGHPWYLRIQMDRLRKLPPSERQDALNDCVIRFARRLRRDPTLGLTAENQHLLPAYVVQHARSIASSLCRARARRPRAMALDAIPITKELSTTDSTVTMLVEEFREVLSVEEWFICLFRFRMGWDLKQVAAALGVSVYRVRTAEVIVRQRLARFNAFA